MCKAFNQRGSIMSPQHYRQLLGCISRCSLFLLAALLILLQPESLSAQSKAKERSNVAASDAPTGKVTYKGYVYDDMGEPLIGVHVKSKAHTSGVITDTDGMFTITLPAGNNTLELSYIGMKTTTVKATEKKVMEIHMAADATMMDEVTIVEMGYNRLPRKDMVGAFTTVKADDIMMPAFSSIDQMLQGKIAGMSVVNTSARVGATPKITIRGESTILGNTDPLWVIDGVIQPDPMPFDMNYSISGNMEDLIGNQISWLNPQDVETITVLKDASATAIYGSKASNGVIVITTKKGNNERMSVRYSTNFSLRTRPNYGMFNYMNSLERIQFSKEAYDAGVRYQSEPVPQIYTYEGLMHMYNKRQISEADFAKYMQRLETVNTDWFDLLMRNSLSQNHNVSLSGGSQKVTYNASFGYSSNRGAEIGDDNSRFNARLNVGAQVTDKLRINVNLNGAMGNADGYGVGVNPQQYAHTASRALPAYNEDGSRAFYKDYYSYTYNRKDNSLELDYNIFNEMEHSYSQNKSQQFNVSLDLDWAITDWLNYQLVGSIVSTANDSESYAGERGSYIETHYRGYAYGTEKYGSEKYHAAMLPFGGMLSTTNSSSVTYNVQNKLVFSKTFAEKHRINAMAGVEITSTDYKDVMNTVWGYVPERGELLIPPSYPSTFKPILTPAPNTWGIFDELYNGGWNKNSMTTNYVSFFATLAYSLKDRYVFNFNMRSDASNRFGQDERKQFDPTFSLGASWRMAEEPFIKENIDWLDQLNLRASYGLQGNVVNSISPDLIVEYGNMLPGYNQYELSIVNLPNPYLKWERTKTWNLGLDLRLFNDFSMNLEYYGKRSNVIVSQDVAEEYGMTKMRLNGGVIYNHGIELSMNMTLLRHKDYGLTLGFNAAKNWNKSETDDVTVKMDEVNKYDFINGSSSRPLKKGYPVSGFWSYSFAGLDPETGYPTFNNIEFEEADSDIDPTTFLVYSGQKNPYFSGGFNLRFRYKSFSIGTDFAVSLGAKKRLPNPYSSFRGRGKLPDPYYNLSKDLLDRWQKPGDEQWTNIPALYTAVAGDGTKDGYNLKLPDGTAANSRYEMWANSDVRVADASFLRCTQISLAWSMPKKWCNKFGATSLSISGNVNNPFVIASGKWNGFDPELGDSVMPKVFSMGLSVGF